MRHSLVQDRRQPLIVSQIKKENKTIWLVPEISMLVGLTDAMKANYQVMKELATHTKLSPEARHKKVMDFLVKVNSSPESSK